MLRYGCAVVSVTLATGVRLLLDPLLGDRSPFSISLFAILLTAWYGGVRPALVSAVLGLFWTDYFLMPPRGTFVIHEAHQWTELLLYLGRSSTQVRAGFASAYFEVLDDEERDNVRSVRLERWHGAPDSGRWMQQTTLTIPTLAKVAQSA